MWWLLLEYVPDDTTSVERVSEIESKRESHVMWWWLLLGHVPDELLAVLPM